MFRETRDFKNIERSDIYERASELLSQLKKEHLKEISFQLKEKKFSVDENCRIDQNAFEEIFSKKVILMDLKAVENLEKKFNNKDSKNIGELLEVAKTISFNKFWFNDNLITLRTSKFDDYFNGVDELIFDQKTKEPLAAVDTTSNIKEKSLKIIEKIKNGSQIKYGFYIKNEVKKGSLNDLPTFIISINSEKLIEMAEKIVEGKSTDEFLKKEKIEILKSLKEQSEQFSKIANEKLKYAYKRTTEIFENLLNQI